MKYYKMSFKDTFVLVKNRRNEVCPNKNFMKKLLDYEKLLFGKNSLTYEECIYLFYFT
jgi:hypothetical protein